MSWKDDICWEVLSAHRAPEAQASLAPRSWPADEGQVRTAWEDPGWRLKRGLMSRKTPDRGEGAARASWVSRLSL